MSADTASDASPTSGSWRELLLGPQSALVYLLLLGIWLNAADQLVTVTLMPSVAQSIGGYAYFAWAAGGFMLGGIVSCASGGWLSARIGVKRGLCLSGALYAAGCAMSAAAPGVAVFLAGRLVQGVGAGWLISLCFVAIGVVLPQRLSARMFSALSGVWGGATLLGPLVGGLAASLHQWRGLFWAFAAQAVVFLLGVVVMVPADAKAKGASSPPPWTQLWLIAVGIIGIAAAAIAKGWPALVTTSGGGVLLVIAVLVDRRASSRILPPGGTDLSGTTGLGNAAIFLFSAATVIHSIYTPVLIQRIHGTSPIVAGYVVACEAVGWSFASVIVGGAGEALQGRLIRWGGVCVALGLASITWLVGHGAVWSVALGALVMGAGMGISFPFISTRVMDGLEGDERGLASAAVPTLQFIGGAIGAAMAGVLAGVLGLGVPFDASTATQAALPLFAGFVPVAMLAALAAWRLGLQRVNLAR